MRGHEEVETVLLAARHARGVPGDDLPAAVGGAFPGAPAAAHEARDGVVVGLCGEVVAGPVGAGGDGEVPAKRVVAVVRRRGRMAARMVDVGCWMWASCYMRVWVNIV